MEILLYERHEETNYSIALNLEQKTSIKYKASLVLHLCKQLTYHLKEHCAAHVVNTLKSLRKTIFCKLKSQHSAKIKLPYEDALGMFYHLGDKPKGGH